MRYDDTFKSRSQTEDDFVATLKMHRPDIGKEELRTPIMQSRFYAREKRGLC